MRVSPFVEKIFIRKKKKGNQLAEMSKRNSNEDCRKGFVQFIRNNGLTLIGK